MVKYWPLKRKKDGEIRSVLYREHLLMNKQSVKLLMRKIHFFYSGIFSALFCALFSCTEKRFRMNSISLRNCPRNLFGKLNQGMQGHRHSSILIGNPLNLLKLRLRNLSFPWLKWEIISVRLCSQVQRVLLLTLTSNDIDIGLVNISKVLSSLDRESENKLFILHSQ